VSAIEAAGCVYCGLPRARERVGRVAFRRLPSCVAHVDLLAGDPAYGLAAHLAALSYPALVLDTAPSTSSREGPVGPPSAPLASSSEAP
jgi:hypothetical protein